VCEGASGGRILRAVRRRAVAAACLIAAWLTPSARPEEPLTGESASASFYLDYWDRAVRGPGSAWPYFGGHGDAAADLGTWKFPSEAVPADLAPADVAAGLLQIGTQALDWDRDGLDVLFLQRLFLEALGVLQELGTPPIWVDPRTCERAPLPEPLAFPGPPWMPPVKGEERLRPEPTEAIAGLAAMLCREATRRSAAELARSTEDLVARLAGLEAETAALGAAAEPLLRAESGAALEELELDAPPAEVVLGWAEDLDRVLGLFELRRRLRPDLDDLEAAYRREAMAPASRFGLLVDCDAWVGAMTVAFDEEQFHDALVTVRDGWLRVDAPSVPSLDARAAEMAREVAARVAVALYAVARRSADPEKISLLREEPLRRPVVLPLSRAERRSLEARIAAGEAVDPRPLLAGVRVDRAWAGNPFSLRVLCKRSVDEEGLAREFGPELGAALAAYRGRLRDRVLAFDAPGIDLEGLLYAVSRLGIERVLTEPLDDASAARLFPWLPRARVDGLRAAWPFLTIGRRAEGTSALVAAGLGAFAVVRDLPPPAMALFKARAVRELYACAEPLLPSERVASLAPEFLHARQNLLDAGHAALAAELRRRCAAGEGTSLLADAVRSLGGRMLPGLEARDLDAFAGLFALDEPCGEDAAATLLRFGAAYDVMTAVFALESHAAGGSFDSPFDRAAARSVGSAPFAALDAWIVGWRAEKARQRVWLRLDAPPDPEDRLPRLLWADDLLQAPRPEATGYDEVRRGWAAAYREAVRGRAYPETPEVTGWRPLDDYIEEEKRHRRIDARRLGEDGADGFAVRAVFAPGLPARLLLDGEGSPAAGVEWISWSRPADDPQRYEIEVSGGREGPRRMTLRVPGHPREAGPRAIAWAQRFAETYWRWGG
jgi:hypothetical protein